MTQTVTITPTVAGGVAPVVALLGRVPAVSLADGGWAVISRPKNTALTFWEGNSPHTMILEIILDGLADDVSQEAKLERLYHMMRDRVGVAKQPSPVRVSGSVPMASLAWVIQAVEPLAESVIRNPSGTLVQAAVNISLLEYIEADVLVPSKSPAARANDKAESSSPATTASSSAGSTYTVKQGDTMWGIAIKLLGSGKRYTEIVELNGISNPNSVPVGTVLKLP